MTIQIVSTYKDVPHCPDLKLKTVSTWGIGDESYYVVVKEGYPEHRISDRDGQMILNMADGIQQKEDDSREKVRSFIESLKKK